MSLGSINEKPTAESSRANAEMLGIHHAPQSPNIPDMPKALIMRLRTLHLADPHSAATGLSGPPAP